MCRCLPIALLVLCGAFVSARPEEVKTPKGFIRLFNGKDLEGWKVHNGKMEVWCADNGILYVEGGGGGWLMTEKEYSDFELRLEYKMPKMGNSGVALHAPLMGDPAYQGMEIQLLDDPNWKNLRPAQHTGSIYDVVPAAKEVNKPLGDWNSMRIVCKGRKVTVQLNGEELVNANLDDYVEEHGVKHPGLKRENGHVGLQSYNFRVEFKNIFLKPL